MDYGVSANPLRQPINVSDTGKAGLYYPSKRANLPFLQIRFANPFVQ